MHAPSHPSRQPLDPRLRRLRRLGQAAGAARALAAILRAARLPGVLPRLPGPLPSPDARRPTAGARHGRGPYLKTPLPKPRQLRGRAAAGSRATASTRPGSGRTSGRLPRPDLVLVTSAMTYWYTGVRETIARTEDGLPADAGGAGRHLRHPLPGPRAPAESGADEVFTGPAEAGLLDLVNTHTGWTAAPRFDAGRSRHLSLPGLRSPAPDPLRAAADHPRLPVRLRLLRGASARAAPPAPQPGVRCGRDRPLAPRLGRVRFRPLRRCLSRGPGRPRACRCSRPIARSGLAVRFHTPNALHIRGITAGDGAGSCSRPASPRCASGWRPPSSNTAAGWTTRSPRAEFDTGGARGSGGAGFGRRPDRRLPAGGAAGPGDGGDRALHRRRQAGRHRRRSWPITRRSRAPRCGTGRGGGLALRPRRRPALHQQRRSALPPGTVRLALALGAETADRQPDVTRGPAGNRATIDRALIDCSAERSLWTSLGACVAVVSPAASTVSRTGDSNST
ncbi:MAG: hypothetical protein MZV70_18735 [Desulfobacterales bacterium]|nr:hypothetical protein [Desulfobacterales bacterium]